MSTNNQDQSSLELMPSSNNNTKNYVVSDDSSIDDDNFQDEPVARRKNKRSAGNATAAANNNDVLDARRRYSKTPLMAVIIVGVFVVAAVIRGRNNNQSQPNNIQNNNAGALRTEKTPHHYTNPFEPSASGDGKEHAVKVINEKSITGHVQSHGGWNEQDENDEDWSCKSDYPNEEAWTTWMNHVSRIGPQSSCVRELKHPCHCRQPLDPIPRASDLWKSCLKRNQDLMSQEQVVSSSSSSSSTSQQRLDVLMLGDSITEFWQGTKMGVTMPSLQATHQVYLDLFRKHSTSSSSSIGDAANEFVTTAPVHGLALGIAGDTCPQLLYRLHNNGELMFHQNTIPRVYWILIGINDYLSNACNAHVIAACNIKVVEYIKQQTARAGIVNATVVINSMLPVAHSHAAWRELSQINQQLECYAEHHEHVYFFNAYEEFLTKSTTTATATTTAPSTLINASLLEPDGIHPSTLGYQVWGNAIVEYVQELKKLKKIDP